MILDSDVADDFAEELLVQEVIDREELESSLDTDSTSTEWARPEKQYWPADRTNQNIKV